MFIPLLVLSVLLILSTSQDQAQLGLLYGFCIFFGWITAIIIGMTFKTLPFIIWNRSYHKKAHAGKTPAPKELFSEGIYYTGLVTYLIGFLTYFVGILSDNDMILKGGSAGLVLAAALYVMNVMIIFLHKPTTK